METCIWCDASFDSHIELEYHVEQEHPFVRGSVKIRL